MYEMSQIKPTEDIRSVTDLKRNTREILDQIHTTGRPVILTVNGRADSVLMDVSMYEKNLQAANFARLLAPAEQDLEQGHVRPVREFIAGFKRDRDIQG